MKATTGVTIIKEVTLFDCDEKQKQWGDGPWCDEPDMVYFTYKGYDARVMRVAVYEGDNNECLSLGHLCGYVQIPKDHPLYGKEWEDMPIDAYCGLTYFEMEKDDYWIGFDCAHSGDIVPSIKRMNEWFISRDSKYRDLKKLQEELRLKARLPKDTYKNIDFCVKECCSVIDQLIDTQIS